MFFFILFYNIFFYSLNLELTLSENSFFVIIFIYPNNDLKPKQLLQLLQLQQFRKSFYLFCLIFSTTSLHIHVLTVQVYPFQFEDEFLIP